MVLVGQVTDPPNPVQGTPLRAIDPSWVSMEVGASEVRVGDKRVPIDAPASALGPLVQGRKGPLVVRVAPNADVAKAVALLGRLHRLGAREIALALTVEEGEGMLPFCPERDATCIGRPWAGVRPVRRARPELKLDASGATLSIRRKAPVTVTRKDGALDLGPVRDALLEVEDTHLSVRCGACSWADIVGVLRQNPLPAFNFGKGVPNDELSSALSGFDQILGGLDLASLDVGERRGASSAGIGRRGGDSGALVGVNIGGVGGEGLVIDKSGPVALELQLENDDFKGAKLPKAFLQGVAATLRSGTDSVNACYLEAKKARGDLEGKLTIYFRIGAEGAVEFAKISKDQLQSPEVAPCVLDIVRGLAFPKLPPPREDLVLTNTFVFSD